MTIENDNPGVIAPPPLIYLAGLIVGGLLSWWYPVEVTSGLATYLIGGLLAAGGLAIVFIARRKMAKVKTNIEPWKPTTAILSDGIYGLTRNPVYVAMILIYLGVTVSLVLVWALPILVLVLLAMQYGVIFREEKYLEKKFGSEYLDYKKRVRRWF